jgi:hypothetical protein
MVQLVKLGQDSHPMNACNYCGKENVESAPFCAGCGTDLRAEAPRPPRPTRMTSALGFICSIYLICSAFGAIFKWHTNQFVLFSCALLAVGIAVCVKGFSKQGIVLSKNKTLTGTNAKIAGIIIMMFVVIIVAVILELLAQVPKGP